MKWQCDNPTGLNSVILWIGKRDVGAERKVKIHIGELEWERKSEEIADIDDWTNIGGGGRVVEEEKEGRYRLGGIFIIWRVGGKWLE